MPVYPRKDRPGTWLVRVYHRGKPLTWNVTGRKKDAEQEEARKRIELGAGIGEKRTTPSFSGFCVHEYKSHAELHLSPSWWGKQQYILRDLARTFGDMRLDEIDAGDVEQYARARLRGGLKASSVNNELRVLGRVLRLARERGYLVPKPAWKPLRQEPTDRVCAWTDDELARLMRAFADGGSYKEGGETVTVKARPEMLPVVTFLANTGARKGEALALTWDHVDLARGLILIWPSAEWRPKSGRPREVPISDALRAMLEQPRWHERWVFPSSAGDRFRYWPQRAFDEARTLAKLRGGPHQLRHTFATHFLARVPDLFLLARILGHSDAAVTRLYAHLLPDHLARARNAVNVAPPTPETR